MKRILSFVFWLLIIAMPMQAAVDVKLQGNIYAEIASEPGDILRAGNRMKLYSEISSSGFSAGKIRLIGINQKLDKFNSFDGSSGLKLDNLIDWAEIQLQGNLFPQGPPVKVSIGNVEVDYSPYIISLKDDTLNNYHTSYRNHRGIHLHDLKVRGFEGSGFVLWGFNDLAKNALGGRIKKKIGYTEFSGVLVDYRYRISGAEQKIIDSIVSKPDLTSELEWEQVKGLNVEQKLGGLGYLRLFVANQTQNLFSASNNQAVLSMEKQAILREYELEIPIVEKTNLVIGYRDVPVGFDPIFRDRTPEFDPIKGYYLGYNPVDRNQDRIGYYYEVTTKKDKFNLGLKLGDFKDHELQPTKFLRSEFSLTGQFSSYEIDLFSSLDQKISWLNTGIRNKSEEAFTRFILTKHLQLGKLPLATGFELRNHTNTDSVFQQGTFFLRYQKGDTLTIDMGIRQALSEDASSGNYWGLKYRAPNGIEFLYRHSYPIVVSDGKLAYDPDYRLRELENIAQASVNITF